VCFVRGQRGQLLWSDRHRNDIYMYKVIFSLCSIYMFSRPYIHMHKAKIQIDVTTRWRGREGGCRGGRGSCRGVRGGCMFICRYDVRVNMRHFDIIQQHLYLLLFLLLIVPCIQHVQLCLQYPHQFECECERMGGMVKEKGG